MSRISRVTRALALASAALIGLTLAACSSTAAEDNAAGAKHTITTAYGDVSAPTAPTRVAALSYDTPWQLQSLGVKPIAVQDYSKFISSFTPEQQDFVDGIPTIGPYGQLNLEAVAAAKPDLIVGDAEEIDKATFKQLSYIAPTVIVKGNSRGDWKTITERLAEAVGKTDAFKTTRDTYTSKLASVKKKYADVIADNKWIHFSLGDNAGQFSVQQPTGAVGNLVVNELGLAYGPGVPTDYRDNGYQSYSLEQLGTIFEGVTVALHPLNADGSVNPAIQAVMDNPLFQNLDVVKNKHVFGLTTNVTDYATATQWLDEIEKKVLSVL